MTRWTYVSIATVVLTLAGATYFAVYQSENLPDKVPIHWNIDGEPDGWVSKDQTFMIFFFGPACMAGVMALLLVLPWLSPQNFKIEGFRATYDYVVALVMVLFAYFNGLFLYEAVQGGAVSVRWLIGGFFLFFALMGNVLGKVKSNFWMGIRTPWTLASEKVWYRTHRFGAWLFVGVGIAGVIGAAIGIHPAILFGLLMAAAAFVILYSLVLYKRLERTGQL